MRIFDSQKLDQEMNDLGIEVLEDEPAHDISTDLGNGCVKAEEFSRIVDHSEVEESELTLSSRSSSTEERFNTIPYPMNTLDFVSTFLQWHKRNPGAIITKMVDDKGVTRIYYARS